jgi:WD40 repeat protein
MPAPELVLQIGHGNEIYSVAFAPDGRTIAAGGSERSVRIWDASTGELRRVLAQNPITALAYSPDGGVLACASEGEVTLWQPRSGKRQATLAGHCGSVPALGFSPDGKLLACASEGQWFGHEMMWAKGGEVQLWDVAAAKRRQILGKSRTQKRALAWSPDGKVLAVGSSDNVVRLCELASGQPQRKVLRHKELNTIAFSPDGGMLASGGEDGVRLWDVQTMKLRGTLRIEEVYALAFAPGGGLLAAGSRSTLLLYDVATGKRLAVLDKGPEEGGVCSIAFSPDGKTVARGSNRFLGPGNLKLWDVRTKKLKKLMAGSDPHGISAVAFSPDGASLFTAGGIYDHLGDVRRWDAATGALKNILTQTKYPVGSLTRSADGTVLAAPVGTELQSWDARTARRKRAVPLDECFALAPDGRCVAVADDEGAIRLFDLETGKVQRSFKRQANVMAFAPVEQCLAVGGGRGVSLWDAERGGMRWQTEAPAFDVFPVVAFSPGGKFLAANTIRWKGTHGKDRVRVWETATGKELHAFDVDDAPESIVFSPDESILAVATPLEEDAEAYKEERPRAAVQLWDTKRWRLRHRLDRRTEELGNLTFSPDGKLLAATHGNWTATLWDARRGTVVHTLADAAGEITCLTFSPDGKKLAAGNHDGWVTVWQVATAQLLATLQILPAAKASAASKEWITFTPDGSYVASPGATKYIRWRDGDRILPAGAYAFRRPDRVARSLQLRRGGMP